MRNTNYFDGQAPVQLKPAAVAEFAVNVGCNGTDVWPPTPRGRPSGGHVVVAETSAAALMAASVACMPRLTWLPLGMGSSAIRFTTGHHRNS